MPRHTRLMRRGSRYYVNAKVPKDVAPILGKHLIRYSLGTSDHRDALSRVRLESAKIDARFAEARRLATAGRATKLTDTEVEQIVLLWFSRCELTYQDSEVGASSRLGRDEVLVELNTDDAVLSDPNDPNTLAAVQAEVRALMAANDLALPEDGRPYRVLGELVRRGMLEATRRSADRLTGDHSGGTHDRFFGRLVAGASPKQAREHLSEVHERWFAENEARWAASTRLEFRATVRMFMEVVGDPPMARVTRADVRDFKDLLLRAPVGFSGKYRGMKLPAAVEASAGDPDVRRLAPATVNKMLTAIGSLFKWARDNGFVDDNPAQGLRVALGVRPDRQRRPFSTDDLRVIFGSPIYRAGRLPARRAERHWLPLLGAFTGARLEELAQLHLGDVRQDGLWVVSNADKPTPCRTNSQTTSTHTRTDSKAANPATLEPFVTNPG